jgi:hypothetical protein
VRPIGFLQDRLLPFLLPFCPLFELFLRGLHSLHMQFLAFQVIIYQLAYYLLQKEVFHEHQLQQYVSKEYFFYYKTHVLLFLQI